MTATLIAAVVAFPATARYVDGRDDVPSIDQDICSLIQLSFDLAERQAELDASHGNWSWFWRAVDEMREAMREWQQNDCDDYYGSIHSFRRVSEPDDLVNHWNAYMRQVQAEQNAVLTPASPDDGSSGGPSPGPAPSPGPVEGSSGGGGGSGPIGPSPGPAPPQGPVAPPDDCQLCVD